MYADTITLFNHYRSKTADIWLPTVLKNVDLNIDRAIIMAKYGADSSDKAVLHVKYHTDNGLIRVENKSYLPPLEWTRLTNDEMPDFITFKGGLNFDFILHGEWSSDEIINDSDYGSDAGFYNYMSRQYDEVFAVSSVARYSVIPHFEILLK